MVESLYGLFVNAYGNPWKICPSPLLSCLLEGCLDSGKDMTNGGSRQVTPLNGVLKVWFVRLFYLSHFSFHILSAIYAGFANTVNSLYNVKKMVYSEHDVTTLENLKMALMNNWGEK